MKENETSDTFKGEKFSVQPEDLVEHRVNYMYWADVCVLARVYMYICQWSIIFQDLEELSHPGNRWIGC